MCIKKSFKKMKVRRFSDVYWKWIPCNWTGVEGAVYARFMQRPFMDNSYRDPEYDPVRSAYHNFLSYPTDSQTDTQMRKRNLVGEGKVDVSGKRANDT